MYECECGNKKVIIRTALIGGDIISCGCCYRKEKLSKINKIHGLSDTRFFCIWSHMKRRCEDPKDNEYHNYGGRGIRVIDE